LRGEVENGGRAEEKRLPKKGGKSGGSGTDTETETEGLSLLPHNLISAGQRPFAFQYPIRVKRWSAGGKTRTILEGAPFVLFFPLACDQQKESDFFLAHKVFGWPARCTN